jgi:hypothetical protein
VAQEYTVSGRGQRRNVQTSPKKTDSRNSGCAPASSVIKISRTSGGGRRPSAWARSQRCRRGTPMQGPYSYDLRERAGKRRGRRGYMWNVQVKDTQDVMHHGLVLAVH